MDMQFEWFSGGWHWQSLLYAVWERVIGLVLISLSMMAIDWAIDPALKLLVVGPLAVLGSCLLASVIVRIPGVKKIV
jgi:hypothetical protein